MQRLDRTAFRAQSFSEADNNCAYWLQRPAEERLLAADILMRRAFNIPTGQILRMDRSVSRIKVRNVESNLFNPDFRDLIAAFNRHEVEYILVGGYAVILHGYSRSTGDLDLWVHATEGNYRRLTQAFRTFGMPVFDMTLDKFLATDRYDVFSFGVPPTAIDLITKLKGIAFPEAYANSSIYEFEGIQVRVIQYNDLLTAKRAAGRHRDLNDIEQLEKGRK
jgi:hypothetical protein